MLLPRNLAIPLTLLASLSCGGGPVGPPPPSPTATATPVASPTPQACPSPATCPQLTRFGNKAHNVLDANHNEIAGTACNPDRSECSLSKGLKFIVYDSTPNFGPEQETCNAERSSCFATCGSVQSTSRLCEPDDGPLWIISGPVVLRQYQERRYQAKVEVLGVGVIRTRTCAEPGAEDGLGLPLDIAGTNCFTRLVRVVE